MLVLVAPGVHAQQPVHVVIQEADLEALGGWPLDRKWYAVALQQLTEQGARRVFIDIAFPKADLAHPESDEFLYHELARRSEVSILTAPGSTEGDSVQVLGRYRFPAARTFDPFSEGIKLYSDLLEVKPASGAFLHELLPSGILERPVLIAFPDTALAPDYAFLDAVQGRVEAAGRDVVISLDYPGITSYVAPAGSDRMFATAGLQLYVAEQILAGRYAVRWPAGGLAALFVVAWMPLVLLSRKPVTAGASSLLLTGLLLAGLPLGGVYVGAGWLGALLLPIVGLAYAAVRQAQANRLPPPEPLPIASIAAPVPAPEAEAELDALRYKLQFYENLEHLATADDAVPDAEGTGVLYHPDSPMAGLLRKARQVAQSKVSVLLLGESGTGKEMLAQYLHQQSPLARRPFVAVNCASFNENLIESELFGHEAGAFTGATKRKIGRFEQADGSTLFLDELAETSPAVQVKLLRVLQEGAFERVGGTETIRVTVRVLAATNQDLGEAIEAGRFREDLYYRLNGFTLNVPPLRQRPMDVEYLFRAFLGEQEEDFKISASLIEWLKVQPWRGNVRQLRAATERAVLNARLKRRSFLLPEDFELADARSMASAASDALSEQILEGLRRHRFKHRSISAVADDLSIHRVTVTEYLRGWIIRFMAHYDLEPSRVEAALRGHAEVDNEAAFSQRVEQYIHTIRQRIIDGLNEDQTDDEIRLSRFKNTPSEFDDDLTRLIQALRIVAHV